MNPNRTKLAAALRTSFWTLNRRAWRVLPGSVRDLRIMRRYGRWLNELVRRRADREMYVGTFFFRNRPALELMRRLIDEKAARGSVVDVAVLGCSVGVEVYSILWILRSTRSDLRIVVRAVDTSADVVRIGEAGRYEPSITDMVGAEVFERLRPEESREMFEWEGGTAQVKPWLREGITWCVDDACDPDLGSRIGPQDVVVASNFLCHMDAPSAERCLRHIGRLVKPGGHLFVTGVDLEVRATVAQELRWDPVTEMVEEIHDGDPSVRADWPWRWWGLEPFDGSRSDWQMRYTSVFRIGAEG